MIIDPTAGLGAAWSAGRSDPVAQSQRRVVDAAEAPRPTASATSTPRDDTARPEPARETRPAKESRTPPPPPPGQGRFVDVSA